MWPDAVDPDEPSFSEDERNPVPGYMAYLPVEQQQAHREECLDGDLMGDSQDIVGVPGGQMAYAECPVCAQDPFQQLRTVLEDRMDALEAEIATQSLSVRLQGMLDGLGWALEQSEDVRKALHDHFHTSQTAWNPDFVFGADPAAPNGPAPSQDGRTQRLDGAMYMRGTWIEIGKSMAFGGGHNAHAAMQQMQIEAEKRRIEQEAKAREQDRVLQWLRQQPNESRNDWKARTFAATYGQWAVPPVRQPVNPTDGMSPGEAIQWYLNA